MRIAYDILAIALFALLARLAHGGLSLEAWIDTFWPWAVGALIGWAIVTAARIRGRWAEAGVVWVCAIGIGMALWAWVNGRAPHWSFLLVASTMSALLLFGWRGIAALACRRR